MSKLRSIREAKKPPVLTLPPKERLRIFANLIIDRILDEQTKGNLNSLVKNKER